jgi:hypothetical protein
MISVENIFKVKYFTPKQTGFKSYTNREEQPIISAPKNIGKIAPTSARTKYYIMKGESRARNLF